jgi:hypothetical protein
MAHPEALEKEIAQLEGNIGNRSATGSTDTGQQGTSENNQTPPEKSEESTNVTAQAETQEQQPASQQKAPTRTNWKQKFNEADKRYNNFKASTDATIFSLRTELAAALRSQESLSKKVDDLSKELATARSSKTESLNDILSSEEQEILGAEAVAALDKVSKSNIEAQVKPLQEQLAFEKEQRASERKAAAEEQASQAQQSFLERLGDLVPDYATVDTDQAFLDWMKLPDEVSGIQRERLFKQSQTLGDVGRVAQFFNDFKKLNNEGQEALEDKVTPASSASSTNQQTTSSDSQQVPYVSLAKVQKFYTDVSKGRYKNKPKLVEEIQAKIDEAQRTGRIVA